MKKIAAIIVTYNATQNDWLYKCLDSLQSSNINLQIFVVDNSSEDATCPEIKIKYPSVHLIESKTNLGFGKANNLGLEMALKQGCEFFFLLNQDAWVDPDTIKMLINVAEKNKEYGIISPMHYNGTGNALDYNFSHQISPSFCKNLYSDFVLKKVKNTVYESSFICAAAWLLTKDCLKLVGGFNPSFFHYAEDTNYINRLHFKKMKIGVYPMVKIYHDRENRKQNINKLLEENKMALLNYSNPFSRAKISRDIKQFRNKKLKNIFLMNWEMKKYYQSKIDFLMQHKAIIEDNRQESISTKEFVFLNYEKN